MQGDGARRNGGRARLRLQGRPFAGELDPDRSKTFDTSHVAPCVAGCAVFLPETANVFALNYQQVVKTCVQRRNARRPQTASATGATRRAIPDSMVDTWGNMKTRDVETTQHCANMYLRAVRPDQEIDMTAGVGKPKGRPAFAPGLLPSKPPGLDGPRPRVRMPPRVLGHTGFLPGKHDHVGLSFNKIQMATHADYRHARNFENHLPPADKVPMVPVTSK
eukprot:TRINITY_DN11261_c0_g2_i1.p2 TRINITY_DN11261_c0_g2~~TRINITY_DN11261_c0_g2_i1.p2  ORF type:complete len:220 (+),score=51.62 TRINITY_DN11261_c0_g2_i1:66-725(+)